MARFYSNENFSRRAVEALPEIAHDVLTSYDAGRANQQIADADVLAYATDEQRILLTVNRKDFYREHRYGKLKHAGIVACTQNPNPRALAQNIHDAVKDLESCEGKLLKVIRKNC
jgi:predicted nuclease of predicted toxin-antitoxin system